MPIHTSHCYQPLNDSRNISKFQIETSRATKDLPPFYGDPRGCGHFLSAAYENLTCLAHFLKGISKAVSALLINSEDIPDVIEDWRELFVQPRQGIFALVEDVKAAKRVRLDEYQTLCALRTDVPNFVTNIKASKIWWIHT